jgi:hypothetical protein
MASILAISTLMSLALAQTTVMTLPYPMYASTEAMSFDDTPPSYGGAIVSANSGGTTIFTLDCGDATLDCGLFPFNTLTYVPSKTWVMDYSDVGDSFSMTQDCSFGAKSATCTESAGGTDANFPGKSTDAEYNHGSMYVTVTKGVEMLAAATGEALPTPSGTVSGPARTGSAGSQTLATAVSGVASGTPRASGSVPEATGAAAVNGVVLGRGVVGAGVGLLAGLLL